jgi:uncharacterized protein YkwD
MVGGANPTLAPAFIVPVEETDEMTQANTLEQLMVDLINEERVAAGVAPLTIDDDLNTSSEMHSTWMLENDVFSHTGEGGSTSTERMMDAGYMLEGAWATGENIGWQSERGDPGLEDDVRAIHESLMNSPSHRANILSADYDEVGIGIEQGDFNAATGTFDAVMITQNFGSTEADDTPDEEDDMLTGATNAVPVAAEAGDQGISEEPVADMAAPAATDEAVIASGDPVTTDETETGDDVTADREEADPPGADDFFDFGSFDPGDGEADPERITDPEIFPIESDGTVRDYDPEELVTVTLDVLLEPVGTQTTPEALFA